MQLSIVVVCAAVCAPVCLSVCLNVHVCAHACPCLGCGVFVCVCLCACFVLVFVLDFVILLVMVFGSPLVLAPTAAQACVTSPWCGGVTTGGPGLKRNLGGGVAMRLCAPPLMGHHREAMMGQDGLHRGGGGCELWSGFPAAQPAPGLCAPLPMAPLPFSLPVSLP